MAVLSAFAFFFTVALAGVLPRLELDAAGITRTGAITFYNTGGGTGACGTTLSDNAATCAVSTTLYDTYTQGSDPNDNSLCGKRIMISIGDKSTTVIVADRCAGCAEWDLDLTPTTFDYIVSGGQGVGRTTASWYFVD